MDPRFRLRIIGFLILAALATLVHSEARAISAFSRQYNVECSTCHDPYPHRTEFGEAFLKNGYVWPLSASPPKKPEGMKESHWVAGLVDSIPLSLTLRHDLRYDDENEDDKLTPDTQFQINLGGNIRETVGFFAHDLTSKSTEAFAVFRLKEFVDVPVNVRYGRIIPQTSIWKPNQTYMQVPMAAQALTVSGEPPLGAVRDGVEIGSVIGGHVYVAAGAADRKNQDPMDVFGHLSVKFGGTNFSGEEPHVDFDKESIWDFMSLTLGAYGYKGWSKALDDEYYRAGLDGEMRYGPWTFLASYLYGKNSKDPDEKEVTSVVYSGEIDYYYMSKYLVGVRFEHEDQGNATNGTVDRVVGSLGWMPLQNLWLRLDCRWSRAEKGSDREDTIGGLTVSYHL